MCTGKEKPLACASDCDGVLAVRDDGTIDASQVCPVHLLLHLRALQAEKLGVAPSDVVGPVWSDVELFENVPKGWYLVAVDEASPAYALKEKLKVAGGHVLTREEEAKSGLKARLFFEVEGQPYAVHGWGEWCQAPPRVCM